MFTYLQAKSYLDSLIDYEKKVSYAYAEALKLERMHLLLKDAHIPYQKLRFLHVAGTKGKGSTATFCAYALASLGYRVGLYTSPHFFDFRERIAIVDGNRGLRSRMISKTDVSRLVSQMTPAIEHSRKSLKFGALSFFEAYTALAFKYFCQTQPDYVVLETGLGGRLDATNVVTPLVSILTHIGYDHTDKLGHKLSQIAQEKAGIIKPGVPVVAECLQPAVLRVIKNKCRRLNAALFLLGKDFVTRNISFKSDSTVFDFQMGSVTLPKLKTSLRGFYQVSNSALAVAAIALLKEKRFSPRRIRRGIAAAKLSGRFETVSRAPLIVVDIAHNPAAFNVLQESVRKYYPNKKIILIFAASQDKDIKAMLASLDYAYIILTKFNNLRSFEPHEIQSICRLQNPCIAANIAEAIKLARARCSRDSLILIAGSFFLASEAKQLLAACCK